MVHQSSSPGGSAVNAPMAIAALVLGIAGFCLPLIGAIGVFLGIAAMIRIDASEGRLEGRGLALGGAILGGIATVIQLCVLALVIMMLPALGAARRTAGQMKNFSQLRGQHQSMVIYASSNNAYLPGLDFQGKALAASDSLVGGSGPGHTAAARYYILLNGQFVPGDLLINPTDTKTPWKSGPVSVANFTYSMSVIADPEQDAGRLDEWRDNANSQAIFISDRNTGTSAADNAVSSLWTPTPGIWHGNIVWGDNHAEFIQSNRGLTTRYTSITQKNDNLFARQAGPDTTDDSTNSGANAFLTQD